MALRGPGGQPLAFRLNDLLDRTSLLWLAFHRLRGQPLLERSVDAGLPPRPACSQCANDLGIQSNRHLLLCGPLIRPTSAAQGCDRGTDARSGGDCSFAPVNLRSVCGRLSSGCGLGRRNLGCAKALGSTHRLLGGRHSGMKSSARCLHLAAARPERRLDLAHAKAL